MKKMTLFLSALFLLTICLPGVAQINQFDGNWVNVASTTGGVTKLKIDVAGTSVKLQVFGKCQPTDCDWGKVEATAYAPNVGSNLVTTARSLTAIYNPGFATKIVVVTPLRGLRLQADIYTRFTDGSGRTNYDASYIFKPEGIATDCLTYNPDNLKIVNEGAHGWLLTDGRSRMLILDNEADAKRALALAKRHTSHCFIGRDNTRANRRDYVHEYWLGASGEITTITGEDCLSYNPAILRIVDEGANGFLLTDGFSRMAMYDDRADAEEGLRVARLNSKQCFIGRNNTRPNRRDYIVEYWK